MKQSAHYLNVSYWTIRDWLIAGLIPTIDLPPRTPREGDKAKRTLRRILVDRADLDAFIEARKRRRA